MEPTTSEMPESPEAEVARKNAAVLAYLDAFPESRLPFMLFVPEPAQIAAALNAAVERGQPLTVAEMAELLVPDPDPDRRDV